MLYLYLMYIYWLLIIFILYIILVNINHVLIIKLNAWSTWLLVAKIQNGYLLQNDGRKMEESDFNLQKKFSKRKCSWATHLAKDLQEYWRANSRVYSSMPNALELKTSFLLMTWVIERGSTFICEVEFFTTICNHLISGSERPV